MYVQQVTSQARPILCSLRLLVNPSLKVPTLPTYHTYLPTHQSTYYTYLPTYLPTVAHSKALDQLYHPV